MAKIGDIESASSTSPYDSGAAILLRQPSQVSAMVSIAADTVVEISSSNPFVVVRTKGCGGAEEAFVSGHEIAQKGLDFLSIRGKADLATREAADEHVVWWRDDDKQILRYVMTITSRWSISARLSVDGEASAKPAKPQEPFYHKAFRYFRLSQVADDLFNAYRNMYLAFELLLSSHSPKQNGERELDWLERGLRGLPSKVVPNALVSEPDPVQAIIDTIYKDARLSLFHAKDGRDYFVPHGSLEDHREVASALQNLTELVLNIAKLHSKEVRGMGGRMSHSLKESTINSVFSDACFILSDDDSPFDPKVNDLSHPRYERAVRIDTSISPNTARNNLPVLVGTAGIEDVDETDVVRRIEVINDTNPLAGHVLPAPLSLAELDVIQCQLNSRHLNATAPKQVFPS
jgi:hypothetical protein